MFSLILNYDWLSGLPGIIMWDWVSDSGQDSALLTTCNFYSRPDSPRDQLFRIPSRGGAGLGLPVRSPVPPPGLNSQPLVLSLSWGTRPRSPSPRSENQRKRTGLERSGRENGLPELEAGHLWNSEEGEVVSFACDDSEDTLIPGGSRQWGVPLFWESNSYWESTLSVTHPILG